MRTIELGSRVRDVVTGFKGIATSRAIHMNGCDRYWIQPPVGKDGKNADGLWVDVTTLEVTEESAIKLPEETRARRPGGFSARDR